MANIATTAQEQWEEQCIRAPHAQWVDDGMGGREIAEYNQWM